MNTKHIRSAISSSELVAENSLLSKARWFLAGAVAIGGLVALAYLLVCFDPCQFEGSDSDQTEFVR